MKQTQQVKELISKLEYAMKHIPLLRNEESLRKVLDVINTLKQTSFLGNEEQGRLLNNLIINNHNEVLVIPIVKMVLNQPINVSPVMIAIGYTEGQLKVNYEGDDK